MRVISRSKLEILYIRKSDTCYVFITFSGVYLWRFFHDFTVNKPKGYYYYQLFLFVVWICHYSLVLFLIFGVVKTNRKLHVVRIIFHFARVLILLLLSLLFAAMLLVDVVGHCVFGCSTNQSPRMTTPCWITHTVNFCNDAIRNTTSYSFCVLKYYGDDNWNPCSIIRH